MMMIYIRQFLALLGVVSLIHFANAQSGEFFTVDSDLSSSMVTDLFQDQHGFIWVATEDGLNRFDGSKITVYRNDVHSPHMVLNDVARVLGEDAGGTMYVGYINGLQYYDAARNVFHNVPLRMDGEVVSPHVRTICQRKNGQLLIGTAGYGIFEIRTDEQGVHGVRRKDMEPSNTVLNLFEDDNENLWIATEDRGLYKKTANNLTAYFSSKKAQHNMIASLCQDEAGNILAGNLSQGLFRYDMRTDSFYHVSFKNAPNLAVLDLSVGANNQIYVASDGYGIRVYNPGSNTLLRLDAPVTQSGFPLTTANSVLEDRSGNVWVGIYQKGVYLLRNHKNRFGYIGYRSMNNNLIGANAVMALLEDRRGALWIGSNHDGIYRIDPDKKTSTHFNGSANTTSVPSSVTTIFEDSDGDFWLGSFKDGVRRFNTETGVCQQVTELRDENGDYAEWVPAITETETGHLWIGTMGAGLFALEKKTGVVRHFSSVVGKDYQSTGNYLPNKWINCLLVTKSNLLFTGTYDGLACLDLQTESFSSAFGINKLLPGSVVYTLFEDNLGNLWAGTSKGLFHINLITKEITSYRMEQGLPSNVIYAIEADRQGNIWVSTNRGMAKMAPTKTNFISFYTGDGLQGNEFRANASLQSKSGDLYFGGVNGITYFNPTDIQLESSKPLSVHIVDFYIHDKPVRKGTKSGGQNVIDTIVTEAHVFNLAYIDNSFTVEFSTMEYNEFERSSFQYAMNDNEWQTLSPGHNRVTFDHLKPGKHLLRYRTKLQQKYSAVQHSIIVVRPIWFLSSPAKVIYALVLLIASAYTIRTLQNRRRLKLQLLTQQREQEINRAKLEFFIHIAHEIKTPLTLVISPLKKILVKIKEIDKDGLYQIIDRNMQRMLDLVNQLMDIRKIEAGQMTPRLERVEMIGFIRDVHLLFEEQFKVKQISFDFSYEDDAIYGQIDVRNFDKVIINLLSNALKFTPEGGKIWITVQKHTRGNQLGKPSIAIAVADSGEQIAPEESKHIFNCFYQAESQRKYSGQGAGIGLHLTRQLVELHQGTIRVKNLENGGCAFIVEIPLDHNQSPIELPNGHVVEHPVVPATSATMPLVSQPKKDHPNAKRIAVVDDDHDIRAFLQKILSQVYIVDTYINGEDAYKGILANVPDLVISDVMMPLVDGMMLCRKIRQNPVVHHLPVVLLTAKGSDEDQVKGLGLGADLYITKPFNIDILTENIGSLLRNREAAKKNGREMNFQETYISKVNLKSADEKLMEKVHRIIEANIANPQLSVEMLADEIGISRVHLHRKLKGLTNLTTKDIIRKIRLKQAADLLAAKRISVSEVAYAVGYNDVGSFSASFKSLYGVVPKEFAAQKHPMAG